MTSSRWRSPNVLAAGLLVVVVAALLLWQRPWESTDDGDVVPVPADAASVLQEQFRSLGEARSEAAFVAAAGDGRTARRFATDAWEARRALGVRGVELRYQRGGEVADRDDGSTVAEVAVSWSTDDDSVIAGTSVRDTTVRFRLDPRPDGTFAIRSAGIVDAPLPVWLAGSVTVQSASGVRVVSVDGGVPGIDVPAMAATARRAVGAVVPGADGDLTLLSPRTRGLTAALVGRSQDEVSPIAAITTTVDGSTDSARVIVLNPDQFGSMDRRAAQVVISHEATHLLTGAVGTRPDAWVVEGFADFVALHDDTAPLSVSAGQVLRRVRDDGPPKTLPSADDFGSAGRGLGAVYESAWLAFRMLGERFDDATIVAFYQDVLDGTAADTAARQAFGLSVDQITAQWRDYLTKSASTVS